MADSLGDRELFETRATTFYEEVVGQGGLDGDDARVAEGGEEHDVFLMLCELGLLRPDADTGRFLPEDPSVVQSHVVSPLSQEGARLLEESSVFAARIAECEQALSAHVDWSLTGVLRGDGAELSRVEVVQPVLWAVMVSLAAVWAEHGITPAAVVGHSQGEMAAACVAGALSLEDAARIVAVRSDALRRLMGQGDMASLSVGAERAVALIGERPGVCVAAVNGPSSTVISGPPEHVAAVVADAEAQGLRARVIDVGYASHGPQIDHAEEINRRMLNFMAAVD